MASVRSFHRYRGETSFSLSRLVQVVGEQLPTIAPSQTRYRVTAIPTERTIRFYTASGIVDKPVAGSGGKTCYGYRHLLQVLAVKYLQAQYLPLVKVRALIRDVDNRQLESMIPEIAPVTMTHRVIARYDCPLPVAAGSAAAGLVPPAPSGAPAPSLGAAAGSAPGLRDLPGFTDAERMDLWHRVEVGPGVELHIHAAALSQEQREKLRGALLREIGVLRGWFDGGEKT